MLFRSSVERVENSAGAPNRPVVTDESKSLKPLQVTGITTVTIGTGIWAIALVISLVFRDRLAADGHGDWPQICAAGVLLGLLGYRYTTCRARRLGLI